MSYRVIRWSLLGPPTKRVTISTSGGFSGIWRTIYQTTTENLRQIRYPWSKLKSQVGPKYCNLSYKIGQRCYKGVLEPPPWRVFERMTYTIDPPPPPTTLSLFQNYKKVGFSLNHPPAFSEYVILYDVCFFLPRLPTSLGLLKTKINKNKTNTSLAALGELAHLLDHW